MEWQQAERYRRMQPRSDAPAVIDAEDMQRHFVWTIKGPRPPKGEVYVSTEGPKGEIGFYIVSDGSAVPYRLHYRAPSFVNLQILSKLAEGAMLADMIALIGTIDIVRGDGDRGAERRAGGVGLLRPRHHDEPLGRRYD